MMEMERRAEEGEEEEEKATTTPRTKAMTMEMKT